MAEGAKVLIVEDDPFISDMYLTKLKGEGFDVKHAENGKDGLSMAAEFSPQLILLDVVMPKMDGFEALKALKKDAKLKDVPVILLTNLGQKDDVEKGMKLGAVDYVVKAHFTPSEVVTKVKETLDGNNE